MGQQAKFSGAEVTFVVHATEDEEKILGAVSQNLGLDADRFSITPAEGHFKNRIDLLRAQLSSGEASSLAGTIASKLNSSDRLSLATGLDQFSDEKGNLYIRLDKQRLCQGKLALSSADSLRVKFRPVHRYRPDSRLEQYRGIFT